jgi:hypothetical protein
MVQPAEDRWSVHQSRGGASRGWRIGEALLQPSVWPGGTAADACTPLIEARRTRIGLVN